MIPIFRPWIGDEEVNEVEKVLRSRWIGMGPKTEEFEKKFASYVGAKHAIGLNSGTAALDLAVKALGIKSGEILVPALTFASSAEVAIYNNAKPVLVDVQRDTLDMDPEDLKKKITDKTKAIIP